MWTHEKMIKGLTAYNQKVVNESNGRLSLDVLGRLYMLTPDYEPVLNDCPMDASRRFNDTFAATYCGYVAFLQSFGEDAVNYRKHFLEVKLVGLQKGSFSLGTGGGLLYNNSSLASSVGAHYDIYGSTDLRNKEQDTALILYSKDHRAFISGFILPAPKVYEYLSLKPVTSEKGREKRDIPLSQFIKNGYEFENGIDSIGYKNYIDGLKGKLSADGGYLSGDDNRKANLVWNNLLEYSKRLKKSS